MVRGYLLIAVVAVCTFGAYADLVTHTGNAFNDYAGDPRFKYFPDRHNLIVSEFNSFPWPGEILDVGVPTGIDDRAGWDFRAVYVNYDRQTDTMQVGIDCYGICGDADGDGFQASAGATLDLNGGDDKEDVLGSESIAFLIDTRTPVSELASDFLPTIAVGWPGDLQNPLLPFGVYSFNSLATATPAVGFIDILDAGFTLNYLAPETAQPGIVDIEFAINPWTALPGFESLDVVLSDIEFKFNVFGGSFEDDGIGEDWVFHSGTGEPFFQGGCTPDVCGLCETDLGYSLGFDSCDLCPFDELYGIGEDACGVCFGNGTDVCGLCPGDEGHNLGLDSCDLCPSHVDYNNAEDECGECYGPGRDDCDLCSTEEGYQSSEDVCGICFGDGPDDCGLCPQQNGFNSSRDVCGLCFGNGRDPCDLCPQDEGYQSSQDVCGVCDGPGRDICNLCPSDEGYLDDLCLDCAHVPFGNYDYNRCGMCLPPAAPGEDNDDICPCYFDVYKGFAKWDLDRIILYYNIHASLWYTIELKDQVADTLEDIYWYTWNGTAEQPVDFNYWCQHIYNWHYDCLLWFTEYWTIYVGDLWNSWWFSTGGGFYA